MSMVGINPLMCFLMCSYELETTRSQQWTPGHVCLNTLRPWQHGRHFADDIFKCIFLNENVWIPIKISLKFVSKGPIHNIPALVQIMAWRRPGDKPLSEPMMVTLPTHICVTRPQCTRMEQCYSLMDDSRGMTKTQICHWCGQSTSPPSYPPCHQSNIPEITQRNCKSDRGAYVQNRGYFQYIFSI